MILWGFLGQVNSKPLLEVTSGHLPEKQGLVFLYHIEAEAQIHHICSMDSKKLPSDILPPKCSG